MVTDPYMFFTDSHRLYVQGIRRAIQEHLGEAFGDGWWEEGVERALSPDQFERLRIEMGRNHGRDRIRLLDDSHFGSIITKNHNKAFSGSFSDSVRVFKEFRQLTQLRNEWAHVQDMPIPRVRQAAELMKHILASLQCEEALQIERMEKEFSATHVGHPVEELVEGAAYTDDGDAVDSRAMPITPLELWNQLQSYLILEKSVEPDPERDGQINVTIKVHNAAPDSPDWPSVHFESVTVTSLGRQHGVGSLGPGETKEVSISSPAKQLLSAEFEVSGSIDINKMSMFRRTSNLPSEIIAPLREEFVSQLNAVGIKNFIENALNEFNSINPDMTLADIAKVRSDLQVQSGDIDTKRDALVRLFEEFRLDRASRLGGRTREIILTLNEFQEKLSALNEAISSTDINLIKDAVHDLAQVQLAVLRVEGAVRELTMGT